MVSVKWVGGQAGSGLAYACTLTVKLCHYPVALEIHDDEEEENEEEIKNKSCLTLNAHRTHGCLNIRLNTKHGCVEC